MKLGIVIAAYNEGSSLEKVLKGLPKRLDGISEIVPIVVNDGSMDNTHDVAASVEGVRVLDHVINRGQGAALRTGFAFALVEDCDIIMSFDADGQHQAKEIADMIKPILAGKAQVALGSRFLGKKPENITASRRFVLKCGVLFTSILSNIKVTDTHNGFRAFTHDALAQLCLVQDRMEHASEILDEVSRHKLSYVEVPVTIHYSDYSKGKGQKSSAAIKIALKLLFYKLAR